MRLRDRLISMGALRFDVAQPADPEGACAATATDTSRSAPGPFVLIQFGPIQPARPTNSPHQL